MLGTKILGFSGKKGSGKNTAANFVVGTFMKALELTQGDFKILSSGELFLPDILGDDQNQGIFNINDQSANMQDFCQKHLYEFVKLYSFADILKYEVCIKILGLTHAQCFDAAHKNDKTHLLWENMPGVITDIDEPDSSINVKEIFGRLGKYYTKFGDVVYHKAGPMTAREVMQFMGTEIFRKIYHNVWVDCLIRQIKKDRPLMAIITDVRFPNEVDGIISINEPDLNGACIRLLRNPHQDSHESEIALDNYPLENYLKVIDNSNMTIQEQNIEIADTLESHGWLPHAMI